MIKSIARFLVGPTLLAIAVLSRNISRIGIFAVFVFVAATGHTNHLLSNPGFEELAFYSGWTLSGDNVCYGAAVDGQTVCGGLFADSAYFPNRTNVHSGIR